MRYLTVDEAAARVGKDPRTIREWARTGALPVLATIRKGGRPVRYFAEMAVLEADRSKTRGRPRAQPPAETPEQIAERFVAAFMGDHESATVYRDRLVGMVRNAVKYGREYSA